MGLIQGDVVPRRSRIVRVWALPIAIVIAAGLLEIWGDSGRILLRYDRVAIASGEGWRLLSGHFVHLGLSHFVLNVAGLLLISYLVFGHFRMDQWLIIGLTTIVGIDLGFWFLQPQLAWYVGLSGLLHGLLAAGLVAGVRLHDPEARVLAVLLTAKLLYEQLFGALPGSEQATGGAVIYSAHLYGALWGAACGLAITLRKARKAPL